MARRRDKAPSIICDHWKTLLSGYASYNSMSIGPKVQLTHITMIPISLFHSYSHQYGVPVLVGSFSLVTLIRSFQRHPRSTLNDICLLVFLIIANSFHYDDWLKVFRSLVPLGLLVATGTVFLWVSVAASVQRNLTLWSASHAETTLLGRPLLFPSQLTHARMFPQKYNYGIDYLLVGIPVGLRGHIGAVMSMDNPDSPATKPAQSSLNKLFQKLVWLRIHPSHYLHRGDGHLSLATKLGCFLKEQVCMLLIDAYISMLIIAGRGSSTISLCVSD